MLINASRCYNEAIVASEDQSISVLRGISTHLVFGPPVLHASRGRQTGFGDASQL